MTRINLLPWREQLRKERERQFYSIAGGAAILMVVLVLYVHLHVSGMIETQNGRNTFLEEQITQVDAQIKEIKDLEEEKAKLVARMRVIEQLQSQRPRVVHIFDELVKVLPDGVFYTSFKQTGDNIVLEGMAESNARVSQLMRNIDASDYFELPRLDVIEAKAITPEGQGKGAKKTEAQPQVAQRANRFVLQVALTLSAEERQAAEDRAAKDGKGAQGDKKAAGKKAAEQKK